MADRITEKHRSWNMSKIRSKDTNPEKSVRSIIHRAGYRFRVHDKRLPGKPDIVLKKYKIVIFVHGCFWHRHSGCKKGSYFPKDPKQGVDFWEEKFQKNILRDQKRTFDLENMGWKVMVVWECESYSKDIVLGRLRKAVR